MVKDAKITLDETFLGTDGRGDGFLLAPVPRSTLSRSVRSWEFLSARRCLCHTRLKLWEEVERTCFGTCSSSALRWVRGTVFCPPPRFHLWMSRGHCMNLMLNAQLSNPVADLIPCRLGSSLLKVFTLGIPQPWSSPETGHRPAMSMPGNLQICRRPDLPLPKNET